ncbi:MAG: polyamine aminopropyltransferase [Desulfomonilia bacterium]|jgi:spermidine synthase
MEKSGSWFIEMFDNGEAGGLSFREDEVLFDKRSPYQRIRVVSNPFLGRVMLLDDIVMLTEKDEFFYHEMLVHVPMACTRDPGSVLIVGGGDGGSAREMLKHSGLKRLVLCEIDAMVIEAAREFFPGLSSGLDDSRVEIVIADGIEYVKAHKNEFDCICIDSTDPVGPGAGLFSAEFYGSVRDALTHEGAMSAQTESPAWDMDLVASIAGTMRRAFGNVHLYTMPVPCYPSGMWSCALCLKKDLDPARDFDHDRAELASRSCRYYNPDIHRACFALPGFMRRSLRL